MNDKFIYIYDVECKQSFIINTQQIVWIDINSQSMMMSASSDKGLFHLDEESTKAIIEVVNKGAKNCCHGDYSKQVGGRYISEDTVIEWLKDQDIIKTSGQEKEARKQLDELPSVAIPPEHDGCKDCKYETYPEYYYPCCECKQNYKDEWERAKIGHWIWQTEDIYQCSECGEDIHVKEVMNEPQYICCPMCGCPMGGRA